MITEAEITEYRNYCGTLISLHEDLRRRRQELRLILEETAALRKKTLLVLAKANRITRHLTGRQRQVSGFSYSLGEITERIRKLNTEQNYPVSFAKAGDEGDALHTIQILKEQEIFKNNRELKQKVLTILAMIDAVKKKLFQLELLELRCRELILSTNKALEAFRHEFTFIRRKIYPFGIFSRFCRTLRNIWGRGYFSFGDMDDIAALGNITGLVLKIADSPVM